MLFVFLTLRSEIRLQEVLACIIAQSAQLNTGGIGERTAESDDRLTQESPVNRNWPAIAEG